MPARPTDWMDNVISLGLANGGQAIVGLSSALVPADSARATVVRSIIRLNLHSQTVAGAWGVQTIHLAIGIASQEAFAAQVTPDPNISTDKPARGWLWRDTKVVSQNGVGGVVVFDVQADIRGARKIENGEVYLAVHSEGSQGTSFTVEIDGLIRQLIKI